MNEQGAVVKKGYIKSNAKAAALAVAMMAGAGGYALAADMPVKAPPAPAPAPFFFVNDTSVSFTYYFDATDPGIAGGSGVVPGGVAGTGMTTGRSQFSIDHFDVWEYGTNLLHGEVNQYGNNDPTNGIPGSIGSREFFGFYSGTLGLNELSHSKAFSNFLTKDVSLLLNLTGNTQNNFLAPDLAQVAPGLQFSLNLPGVVNIGIAAMKEWNHNAFDACGPAGAFSGVAYVGFAGPCVGPAGLAFGGDRNFEWTWKVFTFISEPIPQTPLTFINVLNVTGPKGTGISTGQCLALGCGGTPGGIGPGDALGINETKTEVFEDARISLDASKVFWNKPGIWDAYVGYRYWYNKFGVNHSDWLFATFAPGTAIESTAYIGTTYHFK